MTSFFSKPKVTTSKLPGPASAGSSLKRETSSQSDFEKAFKPFILKKNATLAPINSFREKAKAREVIVIDQEALDTGSQTREEPSDSQG